MARAVTCGVNWPSQQIFDNTTGPIDTTYTPACAGVIRTTVPAPGAPGRHRPAPAWRSSYDYDDSPHVQDGEAFREQVGDHAVLCRHHAMDSGANPDSATLAIGVLHRPDRGSQYVFALV